MDPEPDPATLGPHLEDTKLFKLIETGSKTSLREAWRFVANMSDDDVMKRSRKDRSTYLHAAVNAAPDVS